MKEHTCLSLLCLLLSPLTVVALSLTAHAPVASGGEKKRDGAEMVLVPEGKFTMGSPGTALDEDAAEKPVHEVFAADFYIDKYEVTNDRYAQFLNATKKTRDNAGHELIGIDENLQLEQVNGEWHPRKGMEKYPVVNVTWYGASAYAQWTGKRLPTEAEWEKAARGTDGRKFPWGNSMDFDKFRLGVDQLLPVGSFPAGASPYGCMDMAGNVWEWTRSLFKPYPYVATDGREDPQSIDRRVARGGSWNGEPYIAHCAYRFRPEPGFRHRYLGFRCARSVK